MKSPRSGQRPAPTAAQIQREKAPQQGLRRPPQSKGRRWLTAPRRRDDLSPARLAHRLHLSPIRLARRIGVVAPATARLGRRLPLDLDNDGFARMTRLKRVAGAVSRASFSPASVLLGSCAPRCGDDRIRRRAGKVRRRRGARESGVGAIAAWARRAPLQAGATTSDFSPTRRTARSFAPCQSGARTPGRRCSVQMYLPVAVNRAPQR